MQLVEIKSSYSDYYDVIICSKFFAGYIFRFVYYVLNHYELEKPRIHELIQMDFGALHGDEEGYRMFLSTVNGLSKEDQEIRLGADVGLADAISYIKELRTDPSPVPSGILTAIQSKQTRFDEL